MIRARAQGHAISQEAPGQNLFWAVRLFFRFVLGFVGFGFGGFFVLLFCFCSSVFQHFIQMTGSSGAGLR